MEPQQLAAAVHSAACRIESISSLAIVIGELIEGAGDTALPAEALRRAVDLTRIAYDELQAVEHQLVEAEEDLAKRGTAPQH